MSTTDDSSNPYYKYYTPSTAAAFVFAILFCVSGLVQIWRIIRTRQWFGIVVLVAAACMDPIILNHNNETPFKLIPLLVL
jgi:hypothetical protein